jgi:misacylated tRNA(Ala) deacylase
VTQRLYLDDAYLRECDATVVRHEPSGIVLDKTVLYAESGGQAADHGTISWDGGSARVTDVQIEGGHHVGDILHTLDGPAPPVGARVRVALDWDRRYGLMCHHTAAHLIAAVVYRDFQAKFTGGSSIPTAHGSTSISTRGTPSFPSASKRS